MNKFVLVCLLLMFAVVCSAFALDSDIEKHHSCSYCGMDRAKYAFSRILIEYDDATSFGACSLRCAAVELANNIDKTPLRIRVGDYNSKKLTDADSAVWVIGGTKQGVMTANAKWAFADKVSADKFIKENGGVIATFEKAIKAAYEDMYTDTKLIRDRRKMKKMKSKAVSENGMNH